MSIKRREKKKNILKIKENEKRKNEKKILSKRRLFFVLFRLQ